MVDYTPKRPWMAHQRKGFELSVNQRNFALLMEMRTGKSQIIYDTIAYQYLRGMIDAALVVAWPAGVHRNWITDEAPQVIPDAVKWKGYVWDAPKAKQVGHKKRQQELLAFNGLAILAVNAESITSEIAKNYIRKFLAKRRVFLVADESTFMKTAGKKRSITMHAFGNGANVVFKRILDGTPTGEGPLDLYSQFKFLDTNILGPPDYAAFKRYYSEWEDKFKADGTSYPTMIGYRNLDILNQRMARVSYRVLRSDCADLPPKMYVKRYVDLSAEQLRVYNDLRDQYRAELASGQTIKADMALTRYLRLQQVLGNRLPEINSAIVCGSCMGDGCEACDDEGIIETTTPPIVIDPNNNPRLDALMHEARQLDGKKSIIWARFRIEVTEIIEQLRSIGRNPVRYDGMVSSADKALALKRFQDGDATDLVGSARAGGRGLRMSAADVMMYYSNDFALLARLQSEDRAETMDQTESTTIIDFVSPETIDETIVDALRRKKKIADIITGDKQGVWL